MNKYGIPSGNYFGSEKKLKEYAKEGFVDKAVLINVLHEIAPNQWKDTFQEISRLLKDDGVLIIVEREELTFGEKPFDSDFFVIHHDSICKLFACKSADFVSLQHEKSKKVFAHIIPKRLLNKTGNNTVKETIKAMEKLAKCKIQELKTNRTGDSLWEQGVALAFWTHQFTNASLFNFGSLDTS
jgi:SAM-dependent methyltransferase